MSNAITFRTSTEVTADRRIVLTLPPETPIGEAELLVTIAPLESSPQASADLRRHFGTVRSGDSQSADNDGIEADLARAYGGNRDKAT